MEIYCSIELITGFVLGIEFAEHESINYIFLDLGIIRVNLNWDN